MQLMYVLKELKSTKRNIQALWSLKFKCLHENVTENKKEGQRSTHTDRVPHLGDMLERKHLTSSLSIMQFRYRKVNEIVLQGQSFNSR